MKKKTKITKTLALALTLGLLCSGLAGCGQAQSVETVSEDLAAESVQPTETVESTETVAEGTEATAENTETADGTLVRVCVGCHTAVVPLTVFIISYKSFTDGHITEANVCPVNILLFHHKYFLSI